MNKNLLKILYFVRNLSSVAVIIACIIFEFNHFGIIDKDSPLNINTMMNNFNTLAKYSASNANKAINSANDTINNIGIFKSDKKEIDLLQSSPIVASNSTIIKDTRLKFATVSESYFENSIFIGDSRFVGFSIYKKLPNTTYYCYASANVYNMMDKELYLEPYGAIPLRTLLTYKKFDKIYITLGINGIASGFVKHMNTYKEFVKTICELQPQAIVYIVANMHVTDEDNLKYKGINNENINAVNTFISTLADGKQIFYLDPNYLYDDENGNLDKAYSYDQTHIYVKHYDKFLHFLITHALVEY